MCFTRTVPEIGNHIILYLLNAFWTRRRSCWSPPARKKSLGSKYLLSTRSDWHRANVTTTESTAAETTTAVAMAYIMTTDRRTKSNRCDSAYRFYIRIPVDRTTKRALISGKTKNTKILLCVVKLIKTLEGETNSTAQTETTCTRLRPDCGQTNRARCIYEAA